MTFGNLGLFGLCDTQGLTIRTGVWP